MRAWGSLLPASLTAAILRRNHWFSLKYSKACTGCQRAALAPHTMDAALFPCRRLQVPVSGSCSCRRRGQLCSEALGTRRIDLWVCRTQSVGFRRAEMWGRVAGRRADRDRGWGGSGRPQPRGCRRRQGPWARGSLRLLPREEPSRALGSGQRMLLFLGLL